VHIRLYGQERADLRGLSLTGGDVHQLSFGLPCDLLCVPPHLSTALTTLTFHSTASFRFYMYNYSMTHIHLVLLIASSLAKAFVVYVLNAYVMWSEK
jgi:hypothetical protein